MKIIKLLLVFLIIYNCKEKTFADDMVLTFPQNEKLTIQKFNEDGNDGGTNLIYLGKFSSEIKVKYYNNIMPEPPPPPKINESTKDRTERFNKFKDSISSIKNHYFKNEEIEILDTEENFYDSLSNENLSIIVKEKDTIPLYKKDYETHVIKKHKAFPVFIKNISSKILKIPVDASGVTLYVANDQQFQYIRNSNYMICGMGSNNNPYFELKPNEILIYSFPHLIKGNKKKAKIKFYSAISKEFIISIDEKIIVNQSVEHFIQ